MRQRSVHPPLNVSVTASTDTRFDELARLLPAGWPLQVPLVRVSICGLLTIEVLHDVRTAADGQLELVYGPPDEQQTQRKGSSTALTLLKLLASQAGRFAAKDWLTEKLRRNAIGGSEEEDEEGWYGLARLDNVVSLLRGILCPPGMPGAKHLRKLLLVRVLGSPESGDGYRLAAEPLIWLDVEAIGMHVKRACELETDGQEALEEWKAAYHLGMRGLLLAEEPYSDWVQQRREEVEGYLWQSVQALWRRSVARQEAGGEEEALRLLRQYWLRHVENEDALLPLLELLGKRGDYQRAEKYYAKLCAVLTEEGREPDQRTQETIAFLHASQSQHEQSDHLFTTSSAFQRHPLVVDAIPLSSDETKRETAIPSDTDASSLPLFAETRHLIGREEWLATARRMVQAPLPKKLIVLHGPIGVGKSSELNRLATHFMSLDHDSSQVIWIPVFSAERIRGPEAALDVFLGTLLSECTMAPFPPEVPRQRLIASVLASLEQRRHSTVIMLDNAECLLAEDGLLAPCWDLFLTQFLRSHHQATIMLATKEWRGWSGRDGVFVAEIPVPPLTQQDSIVLLQCLGLEAVPAEHLRALAERVAGIPLGLEWIAQLVHDPLVLDDWQGIDDKVEASTPGRFDDMAQRVSQLLKTPSLVGEHLATKLTPLLQHILDTHLSPEARGVLEKLAVAPIPLGKPALQMLCPRPGLLKELRDASLLVASANRIQLLPMVSSTVQQHLSHEQASEMEERVIEALMRWLDDGNVSDGEAGNMVAELTVLLLMHHRLLDVARLLIYHGWLSFKFGHGPRLALIAQDVLHGFDWHSTDENECAGLALVRLLFPFLGKPVETRKHVDYQRIRDGFLAGKIVLQAATEHYIVNLLLLNAMNNLQFEEAQVILDAYRSHLEARQIVHLEQHPALIAEQAFVFGTWCEHLEEQGERQRARALREQTIVLYRQRAALYSPVEGETPLNRDLRKQGLGYNLSYLGYHLNRAGYYEEALQIIERAIILQEQGYVYIGILAGSYGEKSQVLMALGRFQEALLFDEKAVAEIQRCANAGDAISQEEIPIYQVNRGRLYLRLGRVNEAEQLLQEALLRISEQRRKYRMFAREALEEIRQWRQKAIAPQHQLDWRWVERFRELVAHDSFWWLTWAGPFTEEQQQAWDRLFSLPLDETTKEQLGALMKGSRERELQAALDEQRQPRLHYPAIAIEDVRQRIDGLLQLDADIGQQEPNAIVRHLYQGAIEEDVDYLRLIEATYEGNTERFWECSLRVFPSPTVDEMHYALTHIKRLIRRGVASPETTEISQRLQEWLRTHLHLASDLDQDDAESHETQPAPPSASSQPERKVSVQTAKRFFETLLRESGYDEWRVAVDPNATGARIEQGLHVMFLPEQQFTLTQVKHLLVHELAGHATRSMAGEHSLLGLLGIHTSNYMSTDEGVALYYERQEQVSRGGIFNDQGLQWMTFALGLASGVMTAPQTFLQLVTFLEPFALLLILLQQPDAERQKAQMSARAYALMICLRVYRGAPDLEHPGVCFLQDAMYLHGLWLIEKAVAEDETVLDRLSVGVCALEQLPDLQELGIVSSPQSFRKLATASDLDAYILSFDEPEEQRDEQV